MIIKCLLFNAILVLCLSLINSNVMAMEGSEISGISLGVDVGRGNIKTEAGRVEDEESALYLGFKLEYRINQHYLVGLELSGWTLEYGNLWDPNKGEAVSQVLIITKFYPSIYSGGFLKLGGGYADHWNNQPGSDGTKRGTAFSFGGGYDISLNEDWTTTPFVNIGHADTDGERHNAWALGIGISHKF